MPGAPDEGVASGLPVSLVDAFRLKRQPSARVGHAVRLLPAPRLEYGPYREFVLVAIVRKRLGLEASLHQILLVFSVTLFEKTHRTLPVVWMTDRHVS